MKFDSQSVKNAQIGQSYFFSQHIPNSLSFDEIPKEALIDEDARKTYLTLLKSALTRNLLEFSIVCETPYTHALALEYEEVKKATTPDYYEKWGRHYLTSLLNAHEQKRCHNFKDPAVQFYKRKSFTEIQTRLAELFTTIIPPIPYHSKKRIAPNRRMFSDVYYSTATPCMSSNTLVQLANGTACELSQLKKGDVVKTGKGTDRVKCIVRTDNCDVVLSCFENLQITAWHPMRILDSSLTTRGTDWVFPTLIRQSDEFYSGSLYNILLESHSSIILGSRIRDTSGYEVICLRHFLFESSVTAHPYFGTEKVENDLMKMKGWDDGLVVVNGTLRDTETGLVNGMY
jgi:hypothetical protein